MLVQILVMPTKKIENILYNIDFWWKPLSHFIDIREGFAMNSGSGLLTI
jgi:hypothetical protein